MEEWCQIDKKYWWCIGGTVSSLLLFCGRRLLLYRLLPQPLIFQVLQHSHSHCVPPSSCISPTHAVVLRKHFQTRTRSHSRCYWPFASCQVGHADGSKRYSQTQPHHGLPRARATVVRKCRKMNKNYCSLVIKHCSYCHIKRLNETLFCEHLLAVWTKGTYRPGDTQVTEFAPLASSDVARRKRGRALWRLVVSCVNKSDVSWYVA